MRIRSCGMTDVGLKRGHNEDNYLINEELNLFVVADGMGGHAGGEYASAIAVNTVEEIVTSIELLGDEVEQGEDRVEATREKMCQSIRLAGRRIFEKARQQPEYHGMGTTAVVLLIDGGNAFVAHVGDSRLYMMRDGKIDQVTEDHSLIAEKVRHGLITPEEAKNHRMRNVITRSLGYQEDVEVDLQVLAVRRNDRFLICSDGLSGHVSQEEMGELIERHSPQEAARRLIELACERGGEDNITAVIAYVEEP
ncbi:MAG: Stp1/IreP family PP2C-type Ser/Thr phosphatase [Proteobacteria bacterium]|jgi:PPM family protein phosphatase|nr:Stp1/IreP family PP2C-type Ser/Thr phosphatase [Pseudomonadota bacterium]